MDARRAGSAAGRPPSHARTSVSSLMDRRHVNLLGNVHGGVIMRLVDKHRGCCGTAAQRHSGGPAVTAATDEMAFLEPVHVASAYLVFVAIDAHGRPREIARLRPEADTERRRMREAEIRRAHRLSRTAAIETARGS